MNTTSTQRASYDRDSGEERSEADSAFTGFADEAGLLEDVEYEEC